MGLKVVTRNDLETQNVSYQQKTFFFYTTFLNFNHIVLVLFTEEDLKMVILIISVAVAVLEGTEKWFPSCRERLQIYEINVSFGGVILFGGLKCE